MTTGRGAEAPAGNTSSRFASVDQGHMWSDIVPIEPADGPETSYAVLLKVPGGRVYAFYNHNTDRVRRGALRGQGRLQERVTRWATVFTKYSDDHRPQLVGKSLRRAHPRVCL